MQISNDKRSRTVLPSLNVSKQDSIESVKSASALKNTAATTTTAHILNHDSQLSASNLDKSKNLSQESISVLDESQLFNMQNMSPKV